jgi:GT2 family glycosyltransferase
MDKLISIIIVTYNSEEHIYNCLKSIFQYNDIKDALEVIVVDNCSLNSDKMFNNINQMFSDKVILIKNSHNGGYGHGNNLGAKVSTSTRIITMNPDVRLTQSVFSLIITKLDSNKNIGMLGVKLPSNQKSMYFKPEYINLFRLLFGKVLIYLGLFRSHQIFFSGSFLVFDKAAFLAVGLFDENIFMYHEEADISNRMFSIGKEVYFERDILIQHLSNNREVNQKLLKFGIISREYYFRKYNLNIKKYYDNLFIIYKLKYFIAIILNNKLKVSEFKAWLELCRVYGKV